MSHDAPKGAPKPPASKGRAGDNGDAVPPQDATAAHFGLDDGEAVATTGVINAEALRAQLKAATGQPKNGPRQRAPLPPPVPGKSAAGVFEAPTVVGGGSEAPRLRQRAAISGPPSADDPPPKVKAPAPGFTEEEEFGFLELDDPIEPQLPTAVMDKDELQHHLEGAQRTGQIDASDLGQVAAVALDTEDLRPPAEVPQDSSDASPESSSSQTSTAVMSSDALEAHLRASQENPAVAAEDMASTTVVSRNVLEDHLETAAAPDSVETPASLAATGVMSAEAVQLQLRATVDAPDDGGPDPVLGAAVDAQAPTGVLSSDQLERHLAASSEASPTDFESLPTEPDAPRLPFEPSFEPTPTPTSAEPDASPVSAPEPAPLPPDTGDVVPTANWSDATLPPVGTAPVPNATVPDASISLATDGIPDFGPIEAPPAAVASDDPAPDLFSDSAFDLEGLEPVATPTLSLDEDRFEPRHPPAGAPKGPASAPRRPSTRRHAATFDAASLWRNLSLASWGAKLVMLSVAGILVAVGGAGGYVLFRYGPPAQGHMRVDETFRIGPADHPAYLPLGTLMQGAQVEILHRGGEFAVVRDFMGRVGYVPAWSVTAGTVEVAPDRPFADCVVGPLETGPDRCVQRAHAQSDTCRIGCDTRSESPACRAGCDAQLAQCLRHCRGEVSPIRRKASAPTPEDIVERVKVGPAVRPGDRPRKQKQRRSWRRRRKANQN